MMVIMSINIDHKFRNRVQDFYLTIVVIMFKKKFVSSDNGTGEKRR
jgi:hypothetical protein